MLSSIRHVSPPTPPLLSRHPAPEPRDRGHVPSAPDRTIHYQRERRGNDRTVEERHPRQYLTAL
jgi:hypothetical protein